MAQEAYVKRHSKGFIAFHWINAVSFFLLFLTALPLYSNKFLFLYATFGAGTMQTLHHILGVVFILNPIIAITITCRKDMVNLIKEIFRFDSSNIKFLTKFPKEVLGMKVKDMPKQGFYNGGERINILVQAVFWLGFAITGLILWLGQGAISPGVRTVLIPIHSICASLGLAAVIGHIFLAVVMYSDSLHGMKDGTIKESYAKSHHGAWVDELEAKGELQREMK